MDGERVRPSRSRAELMGHVSKNLIVVSARVVAGDERIPEGKRLNAVGNGNNRIYNSAIVRIIRGVIIGGKIISVDANELNIGGGIKNGVDDHFRHAFLDRVEGVVAG